MIKSGSSLPRALVEQTPYEIMQRRVPELRQDRDEWTLRMMHWHFSQQTGSPFWLGLRDGLPFDPLRDISDFNSLRLFGFFDKNLLRMTAPRDLLPRGLRGKKFRVFETGGTTGEPCRVVNVSKLDLEVTIYRVMLEIRGVEGGDIVAMTPSGPHQYAHFVERLADRWQGAVGFIDFDPRWVKAELRRDASASGYITHLVDQTEILLERLKPSLLYTTSKLLMELVVALSRPLADYGIKAVCTGGTSCSPEESRFLRREYLQNVQWIDTYGNTLVGHALMADSLTRDAPASYYLPGPIGSMRVVDPAHPWVDVPLGQRGRVLTTTLLEDLFLPNLLERDSAIRVGPHPWFPFEGVSAVQSSFEADGGQVVEGLY